MSIKNDILRNSLLLESGEEDDEYRMYQKSGTDDLRKGLDTKDWKIVQRGLTRIRDMTTTKIIRQGIKSKDWSFVERACKILGC